MSTKDSTITPSPQCSFARRQFDDLAAQPKRLYVHAIRSSSSSGRGFAADSTESDRSPNLRSFVGARDARIALGAEPANPKRLASKRSRQVGDASESQVSSGNFTVARRLGLAVSVSRAPGTRGRPV